MDVKDTSSRMSVFGSDALNLPDGGLHILRSEVNPTRDNFLHEIFEWQGT